MTLNSRIPGFYKLPLDERRRRAAELIGIDSDSMDSALSWGGMNPSSADKTVENVLGTHSLPLGVALNVSINGKDYLVPMAVEEPSVIAAASNASKMIRSGGGFRAEADDSIMIAQVELLDVPDLGRAEQALAEHEAEIASLVDGALANLVRRGGGMRGVELRRSYDQSLVVHLLIDCRNAMGANLVNTAAEACASRLAELSGGSPGLRILSNLSDKRCVRVQAGVPFAALGCQEFAGSAVAMGVEKASRFAEADPYRAATHNKGIFNGVDAVVLATGNDWRAVEAGAHAFAARNGRYEPLCVWRANADEEVLIGRLEMPMALGIVSGFSRVHGAANLALRMLGVQSSGELAMVAGSMGLASNLAALRALATSGIQRGHMLLHGRSVAAAAGARGDEIERVAQEMHRLGRVNLDSAKGALAALRVSRS